MAGAGRVGPGRRAAIAWLRWWVASMLFWLLLTSTVDPQEVVAGIAAAAVAATIMTVVQRSIRRPVRIRARWLWPAWRIPILIARDTVTLTVLLGRKLARRPTPPG